MGEKPHVEPGDAHPESGNAPPKAGTDRLEEALRMSGENKGTVEEITEVFKAGAEAQDGMARKKRRSLLGRSSPPLFPSYLCTNFPRIT